MGRIDLIIGPMFSGKTSELLRWVRRHKFGGKKVLLVKHKRDVRWAGGSSIATHCGSTSQASIVASTMAQVAEATTQGQYDVIAIDEGQFFPDITEFADMLANQGFHLMIAALE